VAHNTQALFCLLTPEFFGKYCYTNLREHLKNPHIGVEYLAIQQ